MRLVSEKKEKSIQFYEVEIPVEKVEEALTRAFRKVVRQINMPGFRKGKAPRNMVERRYGAEILYEDAIDFLLPEAYEWVVEEFKPEALDRPEVNIVKFEKGEPAVFSFAVAVKPDVTLGDYMNVEAVKPNIAVDDDDVEAEIMRLQQEHARLITLTEGMAEKDDTVIMDFEGFIDDEAFEGGKGEDYELVLGSGRFIPGFEEELIGSAIGEDLDVHVEFPEDYRAEHLAGKPAVFKCKMKEAKRKEYLPIDDEFAQEVSEFDTLAEWKADLLQNLTKDAEQQAENAFRNAVVAKVTANATMDIPPVLVERQIDSRIQNFRYNLMRQGISLEDYLSIIGRDISDLRDDFREAAEETVRQMLVIEAIGKAESIEPSEEDIDAYFVEFAEAVNQDVDKLKEEIKADEEQYEEVLEEVRFRKTIDRIVETAVAIEPSPDEESEDEEDASAETEENA